MNDDPVCPLCERPIPPGAKQSVHHLIPKLKGGKNGPTVLLHEICHKTIHANFSEVELARSLNTIEALKRREEIKRFVDWVSSKPPTFHARTAGPRRRRH